MVTDQNVELLQYSTFEKGQGVKSVCLCWDFDLRQQGRGCQLFRKMGTMLLMSLSSRHPLCLCLRSRPDVATNNVNGLYGDRLRGRTVSNADYLGCSRIGRQNRYTGMAKKFGV